MDMHKMDIIKEDIEYQSAEAIKTYQEKRLQEA